MSTQLITAATALQPRSERPAAVPAQVPRDLLSKTQRTQMDDFKTVLQHVFGHGEAKSDAQHISAFSAQFQAGSLPKPVQDALVRLRGKKAHQCPDRATLYRWAERLAAYSQGKAMALTKQYKGRPRSTYGWEHQAIAYFNTPSKPGYADVAYWLRTDHGFDSATNTRVRRFLQTLPETLGKQSPGRMGKQFYKHNLSPYKIRDNDVLPVGYGYEGDGHTVDVYVAHPETGNLYRPELTVWIDVRSRFVAGWYLSDAESAISTLFALSHALLAHDHVPAVLFLDNGSGFKARMMNDAVSGFFSRLSITPSWSLPGNSKGKGLVEGWFKIFRNRHDKKFQTYCGDDMAPEINRRLPEMVKRGKRNLPSLAEYAASVQRYIEAYNATPKDVLDGKTPLQVWEADLEQVQVHIHADALIMPRKLCTVLKWRIRLDNRFYQAAELQQYNGRQMLVEYSLHNDAEVRVLDDAERLVCIAKLVGKLARQSESRIADAQQKRLEGQNKRLERQMLENALRARPALTHEDSMEALQDLTEMNAPDALEMDFNPEDSLFLGEDHQDVEDGNPFDTLDF